MSFQMGSPLSLTQSLQSIIGQTHLSVHHAQEYGQMLSLSNLWSPELHDHPFVKRLPSDSSKTGSGAPECL